MLGANNASDRREAAQRRTGEEQVEEAPGLFVAIGHDPNTSLFLDWLDHDAAGYLEVEPGSTRSNIDGVFVAGDVADHVYRQAITAAGSGCCRGARRRALPGPRRARRARASVGHAAA